MNTHFPKMDKKTGRFLQTPAGQKTAKMLEEEKRLGISFEKDYKLKYLSGEMGQKLFAKRWGASKNLIFSRSNRGGRRSWTQMLELKKRGEKVLMTKNAHVNKGCEICGENLSLDGAHWIENSKGGPSISSNILNLCPNCHRRLDRGDRLVTEKARSILLIREVRRVLNRFKNEVVLRAELLKACENVIKARRGNLLE